jgi:hypothetical protein
MKGESMRRQSIFVLAMLLSLILVACGAPPAPQPAPEVVPELEAQRLSRVSALKLAIVSIAKAAQQGACDQDDNNPIIGRILNRLTDELVRITPKQTEAEKLPKVAGGWKQVWSDLDSSAPICISAKDIYQVVSPAGYYWNISKTILPQGNSLGLLRGKYEVQPDFLRIEFTAQAFSPVYPAKGTNLVALAERAEKGEFIPLPSGFPVGLKGNLQNSYVDDTLRIVRGEDDRPDDKPGIFILLRADVIN